jgi:DNA replication and repair protein RecF
LLETLAAVGFRNLPPDTVAFPAGMTLLHGDNGAGKTNLLEAVAMLSGRPSFRTSRVGELSSGEGFLVHGLVRGEAGREELSVASAPGRPRVFHRGSRQVRFAEMGEALPAVFVAPEDRELLAGPPSRRRRFLDRLAVTLYPAAAEELARCQEALAQRNALLAGGWAANTLSTWTEEFISCAAAVARRRRQVFAAWSPHLSALASRFAALASLETSYLGPDGEPGAHYRAQAERLRRAEMARGHTLFGPQREDLGFRREGREFSACASSGEIRIAAALVRLSEGRAVAAMRGVVPLYAIDDFDADLSATAVGTLLSEIPEGAQTLLTTARPEAEAFCPRRPDLVAEVVSGRLQPRADRDYLRRIG